MNTIELTISREDENIRIWATERKKETIRSEKKKAVSFDKIDSQCNEILSILNRANKRGDIAERLIDDLKKAGQDLYDELIPEEVKKALQTTSSPILSLDIDEQLMHIPWELLYDGEKFLCRKFSVGRIIRTKEDIQGAQNRSLSGPLKMLIIADPKDNLSAAYTEGIKIRDDLIDLQDRLRVNLVSSKVDKQFVRRHIRDYDIVHYSGHAVYDDKSPAQSGWAMQDGTWTSSEIKSIRGETPFPFLVFSNACHSGRTEKRCVGKEYEKEVYDLASAFLQCGVTHYIGSFLEVLDTPSATFAVEFYKSIGEGRTVGEAVRSAREQLITQYEERNIIWASYMLYGDPAYTLPFEKEQAALQTKTSSKVSYAIAFLIIMIILYFGVNSLNGPPVAPQSNNSTHSPSTTEKFNVSFLEMAGLRNDATGLIRESVALGSRMYMYDQFKFFFKSNSDPYVHILKSSGPGNPELLYSDRSFLSGTVSDEEYVIPLDAHLLKPDETTTQEFIYILASKEKLEDRQQLLWEIEKLDERIDVRQDNVSASTDEETNYKFITRLEIQNGKISAITKPFP